MATSDTVESNLDDATTCPICNNHLIDPCSPPCLHTFCLKCLKSYCRDRDPGEEMECPLCRNEFIIPDGGIEGLRLRQDFVIPESVTTRMNETTKEEEQDVSVQSDVRLTEDTTNSVQQTQQTQSQRAITKRKSIKHRLLGRWFKPKPRKQQTRLDYKSLLVNNYKLISRSLVVSDELLIYLSVVEFLEDKIQEVEQQPTQQSKVNKLLSVLRNVRQQHIQTVFSQFLSALRQDGQQHVANIFHQQSDARPISEEHYQQIVSKQEELCQCLDPTIDLLNKLLTAEVFTKGDMDSVRSIQTGYKEMSLELVNILLRKSDSSFDKFIEALNNTEQQHVVHILTGQGESPLSRVRRLVLRKARDKVISRVDTMHTSLLSKLISSGVLTDDDKQRIEAHNVNEDRTAELIDVMARKSQLAYDKFLQALKDSGHRQVAEELEGLELRGTIDPHFLSDTSPSDRNRIVKVLRNNMKALVGGTGPDIEELTSLMEQNGFAVSEISEGSIHISFRCFTEESLVNLKRLYTDKTLDKLFTQVFCPQFAQQGLESLTLNITDDEFEKCCETFRQMDADSKQMTNEHRQLLSDKKNELVACMYPSDDLISRLANAGRLSSDDYKQIQKEKEIEAKCRVVVESLLRKPDSAFDAFISVLCAEGQEHVASLLGYNTARIPMTEEHRQLLSNKQNELVTFMYPSNDLLDQLITAGVFTEYSAVKIRQNEELEEKCRHFVDILLREEDAMFDAFISALCATKQEHVASLLGYNTPSIPMINQHRQLLSDTKNELVTCMYPSNNLLNQLVTAGVLTESNIEEIGEEKELEEKCSHLVDILLRKPDSAFDAFISALCVTNQEHVASLLGYNTSNIPMTDEHRQLLSNKKNELATVMNPSDDLIDRLVTAGVFDMQDSEMIQNEPEIETKCRIVIDILQRKPDSAFETFISALCATQQEHVASLLGHECTEKPMTDKHRQLLVSRSEELSQFINPTHSLLNRLVAVGVFSKRDMDSLMSMSGYTEMSLELVNILLRKSDSSFGKFIEALNNTEQQHVVHILTGQGESPLSRVRRLVLRKARDRLARTVDAINTSTVSELISSEVLTDDDKQRIEAHKLNENKTAELIDNIVRKSLVAYDKLLQALKDSGHRQVAEELEGLELRGTADPYFLSDTPQADRDRIVQVIRSNMKALVSGIGDDISAITSVMKSNEFAVSEISEDNNQISLICANKVSLVNFQCLYFDKTLDKLFTKVFCPQFKEQGLESLEVHISDDEFERCFETFSRLEADSQQLSRLPLELLELVLMKTYCMMFTDHYKTREGIQLAYSSLAAVCDNWRQTMNGWPQSPTKHWFKHKLRLALE